MSLFSWKVIRTERKKVSRQFAELSYVSHNCSLSYMYTLMLPPMMLILYMFLIVLLTATFSRFLTFVTFGGTMAC